MALRNRCDGKRRMPLESQERVTVIIIRAEVMCHEIVIAIVDTTRRLHGVHRSDKSLNIYECSPSY